MSKTPSIWMAVLTLSAIVLGVILLAAPQRPAEAAMLNAQAGFSLMTTGGQGQDEALIIVDKTSQKVIVYHLNGNNLEVIGAGNYGAPVRGR